MAEININITNLEEQINLLNELSRSFAGRETNMPEASGSGPALTQSQELGMMFLRIRESTKELFEKTAVFLNNAKDSYVNTDAQIAQRYETG